MNSCDTNEYSTTHYCYMMCPDCYGWVDSENASKDDMSNYRKCSCGRFRVDAFGVDKKVFKLVQFMNDKGIYTTGSCEGSEGVPWIVSFKTPYKKEETYRNKYFSWNMDCLHGKDPNNKEEEIERVMKYIENRNN